MMEIKFQQEFMERIAFLFESIADSLVDISNAQERIAKALERKERNEDKS